MIWVEFKRTTGERVLVNAAQVGAVIEYNSEETIIRIVGRTEDLRVDGNFGQTVGRLQNAEANPC